MGVYARRDSRFWWMWIEGSRPPIRISTKVPIGAGTARKTSEQDAQTVYRAAMGDVARGTFKIPKSKVAITFRKHAEWYWENVAQHHKGRTREKSIIKALTAAFGDTPLRELDARRLEEWKAGLARTTFQKSSINRHIGILKAMLRRAVPEYLDANPAASLRRFKVGLPPITILSESAEDAILAIAGPTERAMVLLGLDALLRLGDVRTLRAEHDRGTYLDVVAPKTATPYKVPVSTRLRAALDALEPQGGWYFPSPRLLKPAPVSDTWVGKMFSELCKAAGVPRGRAVGGVTFHSLRHTGASRAARVVKLSVVKRLGGWSTLTQLARYDHPEDAEVVRAVEAIGSRPAHVEKLDARNRPKKHRSG